MATHSNSSETRELNIFITGEDIKAKYKLACILTSSNYRLSNYSNPIVRSIWSSYQKNTKLKVIVAPLSNSIKYNDLLNNMKSYRHRYILYVENSVIDKAEETIQNIQHLKSQIGNFKTRYIPVIYRDQERLSEPMTHQETCFLQQFPHTHFHAPLIYESCDQEKLHMILLEYIKHATNKKEPRAFKEYKSDMYLCYDTSLEVSAPSGHNAFRQSHSAFTPLDSTFSSKICDDDIFIFNEALAIGVTKSHHVRVMVVGPNDGGKTTLIKRLQLETVCCDNHHPPTEGIEIAKAHIRCRLIGENLQWEVENAKNDFKRKLLVQKVADAMKSIVPGPDRNLSSPDDNQGNVDYCSSYDGNMSPGSPPIEYSSSEYASSEYAHSPSEYVPSIYAHAPSEYDHAPSEYAPSEYSLDSNSQRKCDEVPNKKADISGKHLVAEARWHQNHEMVPWTYCSFWDFAGHAAYYSTHQLFMATSVIYLLVVNLSKDFDSPIEHLPDTEGIGMFQMTELESLKFWLGSIQQHVTDSAVSICLVATHKDKIVEPSVIEQKLKYLLGELKVKLPCFVLDNTQSKEDDLLSLMDFIEESAYGLANDTIPANWMQLEGHIESLIQQGRLVIEFGELIDHFHSFCFERDQLLLFLHYQHSRGELHFYSKETATVRETFTNCSEDSMLISIEPTTPIFLDPMVLMQFINHILKRRPKEHFQIGLRLQHVAYSVEGVLDDNYLTDILEKMDGGNLREYKDYFIQGLTALHILFKFKDGDRELMFMPCLLRQLPPGDIHKFQRARETTSVLVIRFNITYISQAVFHQLVAALHRFYSPMKLTENNVDRMQFYCGYISFKLSTSGLQQMQIIWKSNGIHLKISNFASHISLNTIANDEGVTLCQSALDTTLDCLNEVLTTYRDSPDYELMVICPEHLMPPSLVPFDILLEENGCLCPYEKEPHELTKEEALNFWISPHSMTLSPVTPVINHNSCPTSKDIGRIALDIEVNIHTLAHVLKIEDIEAARIAYECPNNIKMQILNLLLKWKQENGSEATFGVLRKRLGKLVKRREGDWIGKVVREGLQSATYGLPTDTLQAIPDERTLSFCISRALLPGNSHFFFLELGLSVPTIEQAKQDNRLFETQAFELLKIWRQQEANEATLQKLLDTANYVGMDTSRMVQYIKRERTKIDLLANWHSTNA